MKKLFVVFFLLDGCSTSMNYYELGEAYENATTVEEKKLYKERLDGFESKVDAARAFYEARDNCDNLPGFLWHCDYGVLGPARVRSANFHSLDALVRAYERDRMSCGCARESDIQKALRW